MAERSYWLDLFTPTTWQEFISSGAKVSGFRDSRWPKMQKMKPGDYLLCYVTGISRFIGVLEVRSAPYKDSSEIWHDEVFPSRVKVKPIVTLEFETAVPVLELRDKLSAFKNTKQSEYPLAWTGHFRGSPARWKETDGLAVVDAITNARSAPVKRPIDSNKLKYRPKPLQNEDWPGDRSGI